MHFLIMESSEVNNLIIVESKNDKFFIERLIEYSNINNVNVQCICQFECLEGINNLNKKLEEIKFDKYDRIVCKAIAFREERQAVRDEINRLESTLV